MLFGYQFGYKKIHKFTSDNLKDFIMDKRFHLPRMKLIQSFTQLFMLYVIKSFYGNYSNCTMKWTFGLIINVTLCKTTFISIQKEQRIRQF